MPSPAQIEGRAILDAMLPEGCAGPEATIRARRDPEGAAIALTLSPHLNSGRGGEYVRTVVVPAAATMRRRAALDLLRHLVDRWMEVDAAMRDLDAERLACDVDDDGNHVEDDMPTPAWRHHCPLVLRRACDLAGLDADARLELVETRGSFVIDGFTIAVHESDGEETPPWGRRGRGARTVRRVTVERDGVRFSHGVTRCYLRVRATVPASLEAAAMGTPLSNLIAIPGLDAPCVQPERRGRALGDGWTEYDITRCFAMLAANPRGTT